ncbi:MAG: hypothetical protein H0X38_03390 [Planctomycetes bacterium]|nr:hypothetical protein [Planctomycetota bacterium]
MDTKTNSSAFWTREVRPKFEVFVKFEQLLLRTEIRFGHLPGRGQTECGGKLRFGVYADTMDNRIDRQMHTDLWI